MQPDKPVDSASEDAILIESAQFVETPLLEAQRQSDYSVKLIQPGRGSSGYYPPEVLQRDGPTLFKAGTHMYWNHATDAEESARPEGNLDHLAAVLTSNAYYDGSGKEGAGLYARAKIFSDYAEKVAEKGPHTGLSIRARGKYSEAVAPDGKPKLITALTSADSVDFVTKAGAGGKVLMESAIPAQPLEVEMEEAKITEAIAEAIKQATAPLNAELTKLRERASVADAGTYVDSELLTLRIPATLKHEIKRRVITEAVAGGAEAMAPAKLKESVKTTATELCELVESVAPSGLVRGLGVAAQPDPKVGEEQFTAKFAESMGNLAEIFVGEGDHNKARRDAFSRGRAA